MIALLGLRGTRDGRVYLDCGNQWLQSPFIFPATPAGDLRRARQQAELRPRAAEAHALRDTVLVLSQELDLAASERQVLEAARERARASALQSLTEDGQVDCLVTKYVEAYTACQLQHCHNNAQ